MNGWSGNDIVFRGYFFGDDSGESDGKKPRKGEKVKGASGHSFDEVSKSECFGAALRDDFVDISFDSTDMLNAFLDIADQNDWKCMVLRSKKGGHTYWKRGKKLKKKSDGKDKILACGLVADIHSGNTYIPLRVLGDDRFPPIYDIYPEEGEEYQEVPDALLPVDTSLKLWGMKYGEGRNDELFRYILVLQAQLKMSAEQIRDMYRNIINKFILADPVEASELEVILRDEAFETQIKESFWDEKKFLHAKCAEYIINQHHVVKMSGQLHIYKDGIYVNDMNAIHRVIREYGGEAIRMNHKKECEDYMKDCAPEIEVADKRYIAFKNGIFDIKTDKLIQFSPEIALINQIPWNYREGAYSEVTDRALNNVSLGDPEIRALLEECIGYCFYRGTQFRKSFLLTGGKRNGKSTYLEMLQNVIGRKNYTTLDIGELGGRFNGSALYGKLANIADDIKNNYLEGSQISIFKKIVSGNEIFTEYKNKDGFTFRPYAKIVASANDIPHMQDWTGAALDRMIIIPFLRTFSEDDPDYDPEMGEKLKQEEAMEYLVQLGVKAIKRILKNSGFTKSSKVEESIKEYSEENDSVLAFIQSRDPETEIINNTIKEVFTAYKLFCDESGLTNVGQFKFTRRINSNLETKSEPRRVPNRGVMRCFIKTK